MSNYYDTPKKGDNDHSMTPKTSYVRSRVDYSPIEATLCSTSSYHAINQFNTTTPIKEKLVVGPWAPQKPPRRRIRKEELKPRRLDYTEDSDGWSNYEMDPDKLSFSPSRSVKFSSVLQEPSTTANAQQSYCASKKKSRPVDKSKSTSDKENVINFGSNRRNNVKTKTDRWQLDSAVVVEAKVEDTASSDVASWKNELKSLRKDRDVGLWIECCNAACKKWRYVEEYTDPTMVPKIWYCSMNKDKSIASCQIPEVSIPSELNMDIIENKYNAGSIVWAKVKGYPWWPGIICDSPFTFTYYKLRAKSLKPYQYFVVYYTNTDVTYNWLRCIHIKKFNELTLEKIQKGRLYEKYADELMQAYVVASGMQKLPIKDRLRLSDFVASAERIQIIKEGLKDRNPSSISYHSDSDTVPGTPQPRFLDESLNEIYDAVAVDSQSQRVNNSQ